MTPNKKKPSSINSLMKHLRDNGVSITGSTQKRNLRNIGYYHGYKGYRFMGNSHNRLEITDFNQVSTLYSYDMQLKSLLYPCVMQIETALKNRTLEAVLACSDSSSIEDIWKTAITAYREAPSRGKYSEAWDKRQHLRNTIDGLIYRNSKDRKAVIAHFKEKDSDIPLWALFEVMTLGDFGVFYECLNSRVRASITDDIKMPTNLDSGHILGAIVYTLKDLRNAIAHNGAIYDVRFQRAKSYQKIRTFIADYTNVKSIDFTTISDYIVMIVCLMRLLGFTKTECKQLIDGYERITRKLQTELPEKLFNEIVHPKTWSQLRLSKEYVTRS